MPADCEVQVVDAFLDLSEDRPFPFDPSHILCVDGYVLVYEPSRDDPTSKRWIEEVYDALVAWLPPKPLLVLAVQRQAKPSALDENYTQRSQTELSSRWKCPTLEFNLAEATQDTMEFLVQFLLTKIHKDRSAPAKTPSTLQPSGSLGSLGRGNASMRRSSSSLSRTGSTLTPYQRARSGMTEPRPSKLVPAAAEKRPQECFLA